MSVFPRLEYYYRHKERLLAPKLDARVAYGTYGTISITVDWFYPIFPGKLYHPINNAEEASWWMEYYKSNPNVKTHAFLPAPDQHETGVFIEPEIPPPTDEEGETTPWYKR